MHRFIVMAFALFFIGAGCDTSTKNTPETPQAPKQEPRTSATSTTDQTPTAQKKQDQKPLEASVIIK